MCRLLMRVNCKCNHSWESDGWDFNYVVLVQGLIRLGLIKDLNLAITVRKPLKWLVLACLGSPLPDPWGGGTPHGSHHCSCTPLLHCDGQVLLQVAERSGFSSHLLEAAA